MNCHNLDESYVLNLSRKMLFSDDRLRKTASPSLLSTLWTWTIWRVISCSERDCIAFDPGRGHLSVINFSGWLTFLITYFKFVV